MGNTEPNRYRLKILVVDDEPGIRKSLTVCLEGEGHEVVAEESADEAVAAVVRHGFDAAFLDLRLDTASGLDLIPVFLEQSPRMGIVVITAYASIDTAVEAMKRGASDYLPKPFTPAQVRLAVEKLAERRALRTQVEALRQQVESALPAVRLESRNTEMQHVVELSRKVAAGETTVLLQGETGTGKGVIARAIHGWSGRSGGPLAVVHCPSFSRELFESEIFGHAKGAFTGAVQTNPGKVASAQGGTLFLDEVGELPLPMQPKLLRFIQDREYERVGDPATRYADVRIIAATNQDLVSAVSEGRFREDLLYRLNVVVIDVPPLRKRREDILPLAESFLSFLAAKNNRNVSGFSEEAEFILHSHDWPGNVRELQNVVERAVILGDGGRVLPEHLSLRQEGMDHGPDVGNLVTLRELEEEHIRRILDVCSTLEQAAQVLGIDPATLWRKRREYGL